MSKSQSPKKQQENRTKQDENKPKQNSSKLRENEEELKKIENAKKGQMNRSKKRTSILDKYSYHLVFGIFGLIMLYAFFHSFYKTTPDAHTTLVNELSYIQQKSNSQITFQVGETPMFENYTLAQARYTINTQSTNKKQLFRCNPGKDASIVPETYNFRQVYPDCARQIISQGNCSSSYALASVSAINNRWCRLDKDKHPILSAQTLVFCDKSINSKCKGGYVSRALDYAKLYGLVDQKCHQYDIAQGGTSPQQTPEQCQKKQATCERFKIADYCVSSQQQNIKQQIYNHGPVIAVIPVYRDFLIYKKGLYQVYPKTPKFGGNHAVKIIGWSIKDGKNCWLVENTWGQTWGENGIAYILANQDELQIERFTIAPALKNEDIEQGQQAQFETGEGKQQDNKQTQQTQQL